MSVQLTESEYLIKALSHDMNANFMLIDHSFARLQKLLAPDLKENGEVADAMQHLSACLSESKSFLDDLVQFGKTGYVEMEAARVDLQKVVNDVIFKEQSLLNSRGILVEVEDHLPDVRCNEVRLRQVITNLLRNAAIHGCDPENPRIEILRWDAPDDRDGQFMAIAIYDNGPGIAPEHQKSIFLPGERLASSSGEGHGMGLAIVKKVVEHYGGSVRIESAAGRGTAMIATLPLAGEEGSTNDPRDEGSFPARKWNLNLDGGHQFPTDAPHQIKKSRTRG